MIDDPRIKDMFDTWCKEHDFHFVTDRTYCAYESGYIKGLESAYRTIAMIHDNIVLQSKPPAKEFK